MKTACAKFAKNYTLGETVKSVFLHFLPSLVNTHNTASPFLDHYVVVSSFPPPLPPHILSLYHRVIISADSYTNYVDIMRSSRYYYFHQNRFFGFGKIERSERFITEFLIASILLMKNWWKKKKRFCKQPKKWNS